MRYAVISDVHSNIEALEAVTKDLEARDVDRVLCCGDTVGYYANPNECIELLRQLDVLSIAGNHDLAVCGRKWDLSSFWDVARRAIKWTRKEISEENNKWLDCLPRLAQVNEAILFHGCLHLASNAEDLHLYRYDDLEKSILALDDYQGTRIGFFGHLHMQLACWKDGNKLVVCRDQNIALEEDKHYIINPGSVGRSRDIKTFAYYLTYDDETRLVEFHNVPYDYDRCMKKADDAKLLSSPLPGRIRYKVRSLFRFTQRRWHERRQ